MWTAPIKTKGCGREELGVWQRRARGQVRGTWTSAAPFLNRHVMDARQHAADEYTDKRSYETGM